MKKTNKLISILLVLAMLLSMAPLSLTAFAAPGEITIHNNDTARAKEVFAEYCPDWTDEQFREAEILVAGIEHATLSNIDYTVPLETRISGALNTIMMIYNVPEEIRRIKIDKVLAMDYRSIGKRIFNEFKEYVEKENAF